jgi:hypothetical protein
MGCTGENVNRCKCETCTNDLEITPSVANSHVVQLDGNLSLSSYGSSDASTTSSIFDDEDEIDGNPSPAILTHVPNQVTTPGQPMQFEVKSGKHSYSSSLPLCMMLNARSLYNKADSFKTILREICPEITIVSETWERKRINLDALLAMNHFKSISHSRPNRPGGGCAIIYNEERFKVTRIDVDIPDGVEAAYALLVPIKNDASVKVKRIVVGSFYVSPGTGTGQSS